MPTIDRILCDIEKRVKCDSDWHVEIVTNAGKNKTHSKKTYSWNAESHIAAKAIKEYLVARGMTDGALAEPQGSFVRILKQKP
jgi:hypothetical protein